MSTLQPILARLAEGATLTAEEADAAFAALMEGEASEPEITAFLMALKVRGESIEEIVAGARALRARVTLVDVGPDVIDTCGTGGAWSTFNVSTAAAIVAAGAGAKVAKHGNRTATRKSGSADVLQALGVKLEAPPEMVARCVREAGVGFLFAPVHHTAMRHVGPARRALGFRTIFNLIGPLSNPAGAKRQLLGVSRRDAVRPMAEALASLGAERAWVVHGEDGLDEITLTGKTYVAVVEGGKVRELTVSPKDARLPFATQEELAGGAPEENATRLRAMLEGEPGVMRDIVVLNAAAALVVADLAPDLRRGVEAAEDAIDAGRAKAALARLVSISQSQPESALP
jgi:anthranilate phosphoribosyltransferase